MSRTTYHPMQLNYLGIRELSIKSNRPPEGTIGAAAEKVTFSLSYPDNFDATKNAFSITVALEVGMEAETEEPYSMKIELRGFFSVDTANFDPKNVPDWSQEGAMFVLYPFLREHAYALSSRAGFKPLLLPLLEVPTFRVEKPKPSTKKTKLKQM
jgi:preprotein translocase subunit SecB